MVSSVPWSELAKIDHLLTGNFALSSSEEATLRDCKDRGYRAETNIRCCLIVLYKNWVGINIILF